MNRVSIRILPVLFVFLFGVSSSEDEQVKASLVALMDRLAAGNVERNQSWGWNMSSDPCKDKWIGVSCDSQSKVVRKVVLDELNLTGVLDVGFSCRATLSVFSLNRNNVVGSISEEMGNCKHVTHLYLGGNQISGHLPESLKQLSNLKRFDVSDNNLSGEVPDISRISGLLTFLAQNNQLSGEVPNLDFSNLLQFNISNNNFSGPIPDVKGRFSASSFSGNPGLCGELVSRPCPPTTRKSDNSSVKQFFIYSGYAVLGLIVVLFIAFKLVSKMKPKQDILAVEVNTSRRSNKTSTSSTSNKSKITENKSEYSLSSVENGAALSSLVVLTTTSPTVQCLRFEDLLRAPAELLGRGKHGSLYKVMLDNGATTLAVKRIREWSITSEEFKSRMERLNQARHPNVLLAVAFYSSNQEKLLVYEYQPNGSLFMLLHGPETGQALDWQSRLNVAAIVAEALAFMHEELGDNGIIHGNLKSTNILFNQDMDPCISEYGLMASQQQSNNFSNETYGSFKADISDFGVILLELRTAKQVHANGIDLAQWVHSVVTEEWTVAVFEKALISQGASEERLLNLLQIALKCINPNPYERPNMNQVAFMINTLKNEEDRSDSDQ